MDFLCVLQTHTLSNNQDYLGHVRYGCDSKPEVIQRPGTESYTFELLRKEMTTDWICVESLLYRLFPAEEILQFEESNARITKNVEDVTTKVADATTGFMDKSGPAVKVAGALISAAGMSKSRSKKKKKAE